MGKKSMSAVRQIAIISGVIVLGILSFVVLSLLREPPAQATITERSLPVNAVTAAAEDVVVNIRGYGEVRPLNVVEVASEVMGRVTDIHPALEVGEVIPEGERLFSIDPRDYEARYSQAKADAAQLQTAVERLRKQREIDEERLVSLDRNRDLLKDEYDRVLALYQDDQVVTKSNVDEVDRNYQLALDMASQLAQTIELYPLRIQEAESAYAAAQANLELAQANLDRTKVFASFNARLKEVNIETGEYVTAGEHVLTLADDSVLEISVPLDSRDARQWLRFKKSKKHVESAWFSDVEQVSCTIVWTEESQGHHWEGALHRIEKFDKDTRTLTVAVRIEGDRVMSSKNGSLPLVEGMFCRVDIPGRTVHNVVRLPSEAVSFNDTVNVAADNRLEIRSVTVSHRQGDSVYVQAGVQHGEIVITTPLVTPLEGQLLTVREEEGPA